MSWWLYRAYSCTRRAGARLRERLFRKRRLVHETQAFLQGSYFEQLARTGKRPPPWVVMNAAAHGDLARLHDVVSWSVEMGEDDIELAGRAAAAQIIVRELLSIVENDHERLARVQRKVLVPFEFVLMS